jgi:DNA-binding HxlR family transcriptional regulator
MTIDQLVAARFPGVHRSPGDKELPLMSRAVLVTRLHELEDQGIIDRRPRAGSSDKGYWLAAAGESSRPVVSALAHWGLVHARERIKPSDLDPTVLMWALRRRVDRALLPDRRVDSCSSSSPACRQAALASTLWLVLERSGIDLRLGRFREQDLAGPILVDADAGETEGPSTGPLTLTGTDPGLLIRT